MLIDILLLCAGTALLLLGGELLVRGAASLARSLGISAMVVGLTVVAYCTSAPELVVSAIAAWRDQPAICSGNIVGSNILNILLVLGATATICPLKTTAGYVRREVPIMIAVCLLFWVFCGNGVLTAIEAVVMLVLLLAYTFFAVRLARREKVSVSHEFEVVAETQKARSIPLDAVMILAGVGMLVGGSEVFLRGATSLAINQLGMSESLVGLTLVAMGTSLPELAASLVAAYRKHPEICLGNIIGSSIYNILAIGGVAGLIGPLPFDDGMLYLHIPVMVGASIVVFPMLASGMRISRREGVILLAFYAAYLAWVISHVR